MSKSRRAGWLAAGAVAALGVLACAPAFDNPFIADDYAFLELADRFSRGGGSLGDFPVGWRRATSSLFFTLCYWLFGLAPAGYYAANSLLHLLNAALAGWLGRELTGENRVGFVAALFFVVYERPQEAVYWITAHHELFVAAGVLATAIFFARYRRTGRAGWYAGALVAFLFAGFSKESFVVAAPLLLLVDWALGPPRSWRGWALHAPFWGVSGAYLLLMRVGPWAREFYVADYAVTAHFFPVFFLSLHRLLLQVWPFLLLVVVARWRGKAPGSSGAVLPAKPLLFFLGWLLVTLGPYSFVLYVDYLPSRHTYLPAVGTAGLVAVLFAGGWRAAQGRKSRSAVMAALLVVCLGANVVHRWRKDADYLERAVPTEQLIEVVSRVSKRLAAGQRVVVQGFPLPPAVVRGAVRFFTPVPLERLVTRSARAEVAPGSLLLRWDAEARKLRPVPRQPQEEKGLSGQ